MTATGTLFGLGLGPGDPELITLKALRLLRAAPVVAYPAPTGGASFARSIVAEFLASDQIELRVDRLQIFAAQPVVEHKKRVRRGDRSGGGQHQGGDNCFHWVNSQRVRCSRWPTDRGR